MTRQRYQNDQQNDQLNNTLLGEHQLWCQVPTQYVDKTCRNNFQQETFQYISGRCGLVLFKNIEDCLGSGSDNVEHVFLCDMVLGDTSLVRTIKYSRSFENSISGLTLSRPCFFEE